MKTFNIRVKKTITGYFDIKIEAESKTKAIIKFYAHTTTTPDILDCNGLYVGHKIDNIETE